MANTATMRDIELAVQVVAARFARDDETLKRVIEDEPQIGNALIGLACSLVESLSSMVGVEPTALLDMMLLQAAGLTAREEGT